MLSNLSTLAVRLYSHIGYNFPQPKFGQQVIARLALAAHNPVQIAVVDAEAGRIVADRPGALAPHQELTYSICIHGLHSSHKLLYSSTGVRSDSMTKRSGMRRDEAWLKTHEAKDRFSTVPNVHQFGPIPGTLTQEQHTALSKLPGKYRNIKTDGYSSKREAQRATVLAVLQAGGSIRNLQKQVRFLLIPSQVGERPTYYVADFVYDERANDGWTRVVEDCKGMRTPLYVIKRKLMLFLHKIRIRET
jgi:hypothetical protein